MAAGITFIIIMQKRGDAKKKITNEPKPVPMETLNTISDNETITVKGDG